MKKSTIPGIMKKFLHRFSVALTSTTAIIVLLAACGKPPGEPLAEPQVTTKPDPVAPQATPEPTAASTLGSAEEPTPEPSVTSTPEPAAESTAEPAPLASPSPVADTIPPQPLRQVWVAMAFQSESEYGTHDFPVGAQVNLLAIEGEDYLVEYEGVSVKNNKAFFSEVPIAVETLATEVTPEAGAQTEPTPTPEPLATPAPADALSLEQKKVEDLSGKIQALDAERRALQEEIAQDTADSTADKSATQKRIEELKKERDQLGEELTEISKP